MNFNEAANYDPRRELDAIRPWPPGCDLRWRRARGDGPGRPGRGGATWAGWMAGGDLRSEEHTSELQSHSDLVCRLLLQKKKVLASNNDSIPKRDSRSNLLTPTDIMAN